MLSFGTKFDYFLIGLCVLTAVGAGVAMPLMFVGMFRMFYTLFGHYLIVTAIVLGNLVGNFTGYFTENSGVTRQQFDKALNNQALLIVYIFIGRFCLSYISMVRNGCIGRRQD